MSVCVKLIAPVALLALISVGVLAMGHRGDESLRDHALLVSMAGVIAVLVVFVQALSIRSGLAGLAERTRATAWGERDDAFARTVADDEIGRTVQEMRDLAVSMRDVIAQRAEMERLAMTDPLTGLPNRRGMHHILDRLVEAGNGLGVPDPLGILHIDLDHFKSVNDRLGHDGGDHVLQEAVRLISSAMRDTDLVARLGGDEFIIIAPKVDSERTLERIAERVIAMFEQPIIYQNRSAEVGATIGIVLGGLRGRVIDPTRLLLHADIALCHAKAGGRNQHAVFNSTMARTQRQRQSQAEEIRKALIHDAIKPWFLPTVDTVTGAVTGLDAVMRWHRPGYGTLEPDDFLQAAEAHNMLEDLGFQIMEQACRQAAQWRRDGRSVPPLHFSLTRTQLFSLSAVDRVSWLLDDCNLAPDQIRIDISERDCTGRGSDLAHATLRRLSELGIPVVLDDFGVTTGALTNLDRLPISQIKAAPELTIGLSRASDNPDVLLRCLHGISGELGLSIIAKQVASQEQADALARTGITEIQGDLIAPAMDAADLTTWMAAREGRTADANGQIAQAVTG